MKKYMVIIAILIFGLGVLVGRGLKYKAVAPVHIETSPKAKAVIPQAREKLKPSLKPLTGFAVQVGSFKDKSMAQSEVAKLKGRGYNAYLMTVDLPSKGTRHRVRVGEFASREEAGTVLKELKAQQGLKDAFVISR